MSGVEDDKSPGEKVKDNASPPWGNADTLSAKVPISKDPPSGDQMPTAVWLIDIGKVFAVIYLNGALEDAQLKKAESHPLLAKLDDYEKRLHATIDHHRKQQQSECIGEMIINLFHKPEKIDDPEVLLPEIAQFVKGLTPQQSQAVGIEEHQPAQRPVQKVPNTLQDYKDIFRLIPLPAVAETFDSDETFSIYRVAGPNPMMIRCVTATELVARIGHRITDQKFNEILKTNGDSIEKAGAEGRLCITDYHELSGTSPIVVIGSSFVSDPIAVFAEPLYGKIEAIVPIAIQLGQDPKNSECVLADTVDTYRWQMAKTTVQVADMVHHEMISHLAHTHLVMEAFSVATQRNFKEDHPISRLLRPHFEGTNLINFGAASNLINADGPIDEIFANDSPARLRSLQGLATRARLGFDFVGRRPDKELKSRGVMKLKVFPYRDDVLDVWHAIERWAHEYVELYYEQDGDVEKDLQLAKWSHDLLTHGDLINFEAPKTKQLLVETLSMIMFVASAQHAAVNFPQKQFMTFAPAMTGAVWANLPPSDEYATEKQWLRLMPPISVAEAQLRTQFLLGSVHYRALGEYHSNRFPYCGTLEKKVEPVLTAFKEELKAIETLIERRNSRRGSFAYRYLLPSEIPVSINI